MRTPQLTTGARGWLLFRGRWMRKFQRLPENILVLAYGCFARDMPAPASSIVRLQALVFCAGVKGPQHVDGMESLRRCGPILLAPHQFARLHGLYQLRVQAPEVR